MSDTSKRSMFGRIFGGGKTEAPPKEEEQARPPHEPAAAVSEEFQEEAAQDNSTVSVFGRMLGGKAAPKAEEAPPPDEPASDTEELTDEAREKTSRFGWFQRLRQGLTKTSSRLTEGITGVFAKQKLDDETLEQLEDLLIQADLGLNIASRVTDTLRQSRYNSNISSEEVRDILAQEVEKVLAPVAEPLEVELGQEAACHPCRRRQRHRQNHHNREIREPVCPAGPSGDARGGRYLPGGSDRAAQDLG